jgi:diguanylate cyclase (GGDEF)-like protein
MQRDVIPEPEGWQDALTGLEGPQYWRRILDGEHARSLRYRRPVTVVVMELVGLLEVIDSRGIEAGLMAIREAGRCLRQSSRTSDHCARIGPSRFGIVLTETNEVAAINFVERVRETGPGLMSDAGNGIVLAFGWASPGLGESPEALLGRATRRLDDEASSLASVATG